MQISRSLSGLQLYVPEDGSLAEERRSFSPCVWKARPEAEDCVRDRAVAMTVLLCAALSEGQRRKVGNLGSLSMKDGRLPSQWLLRQGLWTPAALPTGRNRALGKFP